MTRTGHANRLFAAEPLKLAVLQHAQQFGLRRLVQVADLVEEDAAAVGQLELAAPQRRGAGERAFLVAEQLALDELGGNRRAIHFDEGARGERAFAMDVLGEQLLAGSRLARQQHASIRSRNLCRLHDGMLERGAAPDHPRTVANHLAVALVLELQIRSLESVLHDQEHPIARERLLEKVERATARRLDCVANRPVARDHDCRRRIVALPERPQEIDAVAVRKPHIQQIQIGRPQAALRAGTRHRLANGDAISLAFENQAQRQADIGFVIDDDDVAFAGHTAAAARDSGAAGSVTLNPAPPSSPFTSVISPPSSNAFLRAIESPSPMPSLLERDRRLEQRAARFVAQARPGVVHFHDHLPALRVRHRQHRSARAGRLGGVLQQVGQDAFDQVRSGMDARTAHIEPEAVGGVRVGRPQQRHALGDRAR